MPYFKHEVFTKSDSTAFDNIFTPGTKPPYSGIYR
jgi:hypothetical protein